MENLVSLTKPFFAFGLSFSDKVLEHLLSLSFGLLFEKKGKTSLRRAKAKEKPKPVGKTYRKD
jgi:hypothetical protein